MKLDLNIIRNARKALEPHKVDRIILMIHLLKSWNRQQCRHFTRFEEDNLITPDSGPCRSQSMEKCLVNSRISREKEEEKPLNSYFIELWSYCAFVHMDLPSCDMELLASLFQYLRKSLENMKPPDVLQLDHEDPWLYQESLFSVQDRLLLLDEALKTVNDARKAERNGNSIDACKLWVQLFGDVWPQRHRRRTT